MGIVKIPQWQNCLNGRVYSLLGRSFYWGLSDCVMITAHCMDAMCGTARWIEYKDKWTSRRTALKYSKKHGGFYNWLVAEGTVKVTDPIMGDFVFVPNRIGMDIVGTVIGNDLVVTSSELSQVVELERLVAFTKEDDLRVLRIPE